MGKGVLNLLKALFAFDCIIMCGQTTPGEKKMRKEPFKKTIRKTIRRCRKLLAETNSYDFSDDPCAQDLVCKLDDAMAMMHDAMRLEDYQGILKSYDNLTHMFYRASYYFSIHQ